jgi:hypothetical protein
LVFNRKQPPANDARRDAQSGLVEMLLDADELERRKLLLMALQTGELKKSEASPAPAPGPRKPAQSACRIIP